MNESPKWTPLQRVAQPYEVANVVYFLCGDESSFINGENITIDGGYGNVSILLQKEMESSRIYGGYDDLIDRYNKAQPNETILALDIAISQHGYAWTNDPKEIEYLNSIINAQKRGVNCYRFIILPNDKISQFKTQNKTYLKFKNLMNNTHILSKEEIFEKLRDVYEIMGSGCDVYIDKNGKKSSFIDFYSNDDCVGALCDNEKIVDNLYEKITKLKYFVDNDKLTKY